MEPWTCALQSRWFFLEVMGVGIVLQISSPLCCLVLVASASQSYVVGNSWRACCFKGKLLLSFKFEVVIFIYFLFSKKWKGTSFNTAYLSECLSYPICSLQMMHGRCADHISPGAISPYLQRSLDTVFSFVLLAVCNASVVVSLACFLCKKLLVSLCVKWRVFTYDSKAKVETVSFQNKIWKKNGKKAPRKIVFVAWYQMIHQYAAARRHLL